MKKHMICLLTALMLSLALTSCEDAPENVTERDSVLDNTEEAVIDDTHRFGDPEQIRGQLAEDVGKKYGSITVKYASAGNGKEMPVYKVEVGGGNYTVKELAKYLYGERFNLDSEKFHDHIPWNDRGSEPVENPDPHTKEADGIDLVPFSVMYDVYSCSPYEDDATCIAVVFSDGSCWGSQTGLNAYGEDYDAMWLGKEEAHYYPYYEDVSAVSYKMSDGVEWALSDAVSFTEKFWNEELTKNDPQEFEYYVRRVDVFSLPSGKGYGYLFMPAYRDREGRLFDCDSYDEFALEAKKAYEGKRFFIGQDLWQLSLKKDEITRFSKHHSFKVTEKLEDSGKLLTLGGAMERLREELSEYINLDFETAELCYQMTCDKYPDKDYGGKVKYSSYFACKRCEIEIRPYWCFRSTNGMIDSWNTTENYYVDAVTGEITKISLRNSL